MATMRPWLIAALLALTACAGTSSPATATAIEPSETVPPAPTTAAAVTSTTSTETTVPAGPAYDVYLAAVADVVAETRFADAPYDDPELFAATGLLVCERLAAGQSADDFVFEYLTELTGGDAASADDDQLVLVGAIVGAATEALCVEAP